jgi:hypothetical protein
MLQSQGEGEKSQLFKTYSIAQTAVSFSEKRPICQFFFVESILLFKHLPTFGHLTSSGFDVTGSACG